MIFSNWPTLQSGTGAGFLQLYAVLVCKPSLVFFLSPAYAQALTLFGARLALTREQLQQMLA